MATSGSVGLVLFEGKVGSTIGSLAAGPSRAVGPARAPLLPRASSETSEQVGFPSTTDPQFYYQTGVQPMVENSNSSQAFTNLSVAFTLPTSPTATGYELNGVTAQGDWIQMAFGENWNLGFSLCALPTYRIFFALWNNTGSVVKGATWWQSGLCSQPFVPNAGDEVSLSMSLNCPMGGTGSVCLTYTDLTQGKTATNIQTQPEFSAHHITASTWLNFPNPSSKFGYFVGPATESYMSATSCPFFHLPEVSYLMNSPDRLSITTYAAWQHEWVPATNTNCTLGVFSPATLNATPQTIYRQVAQPDSEGVDLVGGQNVSAWLNLLYGGSSLGLTQFTTNAVGPWTATPDAGPNPIDLGQSTGVFMVTPNTTLTLSTCLWWVNGSPAGPSSHPCEWSALFSTPGQYRIQGIAQASDGTVEGVLPNPLGLPTYTGVVVQVFPDPVVSLSASSSNVTVSSVTVFTPVTFQAYSGLGDPPYRYAWSGLPPPCHAIDTQVTVTCAPTVSGTYSVQVTLTDSLGFSVSASVLRFMVDPPCSTCLYNVMFTKIELLAPYFGSSLTTTVAWSPRLLLVCAGCEAPEAIAPSALSTPPTYVFQVPNGTYEYVLVGPHGDQLSGISPVGNVTVNGTSVTTDVDFRHGPTSTVVFSATGLPHGTTWCAEFGGVETCTSRGSVSTSNLTPGWYPYLVGPIDGYSVQLTEEGSALPTSGWVDIESGSVQLKLAYVASTYQVAFVEVGLTPHTHWSVRITGLFAGHSRSEALSTSGTTIDVLLANGTYSYTVKTVKGYAPVAPSELTVYWTSQQVVVLFLRT